MYLGSSTTKFDEKIFTKLVYLLETLMETSLTFKWAIWAFCEGYTLSSILKLILRVATYTIKVLWSGSRTAVANFFYFISLTFDSVKYFYYSIKPPL